MIKSKSGKVAVGILTILPVLYFAYFVFFIFSTMASGQQAIDQAQFNLLFAMHFACMALTFGLLIFYIVHLFRTPTIANDKKALWAVILFFGNMVAMIIYWFLYIWPDNGDSVPG